MNFFPVGSVKIKLILAFLSGAVFVSILQYLQPTSPSTTTSSKHFHLFPQTWLSNSHSHECHCNKDLTPNITRRIHQTWKSHSLPPRFILYSATWKTCYPHWNYTLWNDTENRFIIQKHFPWFLKTYDNFAQNIHRADAIRYFYMYLYGGIYTDLDTDCLRPFEDLLMNYSLVFGGMEGTYVTSIDQVYVQNSFFYSRPNHPFWIDVAHEMMLINEGVESLTGPIMLMQVMLKTRQKYEKQWKIYAPSYFNPFSWIKNSHPMPQQCKSLNTMSIEDYEICRKYFVNRSNTYVVQYHSQTWRHGKIIK